MARSAHDEATDLVANTAYAMGGLMAIPVPIPGAHTVACTAAEAAIIVSVAAVYGHTLTKLDAAKLVPTLGGAVVVGKGLSALFGETLGQIPLIGWGAKGVIAGSVIAAIGYAAVAHFESQYPGRLAQSD